MIKTLSEISKMLNDDKDYNFLRENEHLKDKIALLTLGGSYAYGTNTETSDIDIRGCALNSKSDILGLSNFKQFVNEKTDTTIYGFNELINLFINCNPNVIEMLGCKPEHYFVLSDVGKALIDNRKLFLSQRAFHSFGGYANQQLRKLENMTAPKDIDEKMKEKHKLSSMKGMIDSFEQRYSAISGKTIHLFLDRNPNSSNSVEIFADIDLKHCPIREFNGMLNEVSNVLGTYETLTGRNKKKDSAHMDKHAMHLVRLYLMGLDIMEKEEICTYRKNERELLLEIRNGKFRNEDGSYKSEFFEMVNDFEKRWQYAKENTNLPKHPDMKKVEEFVMSVNARSIG